MTFCIGWYVAGGAICLLGKQRYTAGMRSEISALSCIDFVFFGFSASHVLIYCLCIAAPLASLSKHIQFNRPVVVFESRIGAKS
jgi:hypothetical protein